MKPNCLILSLDDKLIFQDRQDTELRFIDYENSFNRLFVIVPSVDKDFKKIVGRNILINSFEGSKYIRAIRILWYIRYLSKIHRLDLIISNDPILGYFGLIVRIFGCKAKLNINAFGLEIGNHDWVGKSPRNRIQKEMQLIALKNADSIRVDSRMAVRQLIGFGIEEKRIYFIPVIPSIKMVQKFSAISNKQKGNKILAVGELIPQKGYEILLSVYKRILLTLPNTHLTIIGDGPLKEKLIKSFPNTTSFEGRVDYDRLPNFYENSTLLIHSAWYEGGPRVIMEAALTGLPVVSTNVGSVKDILGKACDDLVAECGDIDTLTEKAIQLLKNEVTRKKIGRMIKIRGRKYCNYEQNLKKLSNMWTETLTK